MIIAWPLQSLGKFCTVASVSWAWYQSWQINPANPGAAKISRLWRVCKAFLLPNQPQGAISARWSWPLTCISCVRRWSDLYSLRGGLNRKTSQEQLVRKLLHRMPKKLLLDFMLCFSQESNPTSLFQEINTIISQIQIQSNNEKNTPLNVTIKTKGANWIFNARKIRPKSLCKLSTKSLAELLARLLIESLPTPNNPLINDSAFYNLLIQKLKRELISRLRNTDLEQRIQRALHPSNLSYSLTIPNIQFNTSNFSWKNMEHYLKNQVNMYLLAFFTRLLFNFLCIAADRKRMFFPKKINEWIFSIGTIINIYHDFKVILYLRTVAKALSTT